MVNIKLEEQEDSLPKDTVEPATNALVNKIQGLGSLPSTASLRPIPYTTRPSSLFSRHSKALAQRQPLSTILQGTR